MYPRTSSTTANGAGFLTFSLDLAMQVKCRRASKNWAEKLERPLEIGWMEAINPLKLNNKFGIRVLRSAPAGNWVFLR